MTTLDLDPSYVDIVRRLAQDHLSGVELWAYGSRVTGHAHAGSDLDLVVRQNANSLQACPGLAAFRAALDESNLPILVDVKDWALIPTEFRRVIDSSHVVLWGAKS